MNEATQVARLLDGISNIDLTEDQMNKLSERVGLQPVEIKNLLDQTIKNLNVSPLKNPLSEDEVSEQLAEEGKVSAIVSIDFDELIGRLDEDAIEELGSELVGQVVGQDLELSDVEYKALYAEDNTIYLRVSGIVNEENND